MAKTTFSGPVLSQNGVGFLGSITPGYTGLTASTVATSALAIFPKKNPDEITSDTLHKEIKEIIENTQKQLNDSFDNIYIIDLVNLYSYHLDNIQYNIKNINSSSVVKYRKEMAYIISSFILIDLIKILNLLFGTKKDS